MDDMGYNQQLQSVNMRNQNIIMDNENQRQLNIKYQQDYNNKVETDKVGDDLSYGTDVLSNVFGASAIKGAIDNRKARIARELKQAKNAVSTDTPVSPFRASAVTAPPSVRTSLTAPTSNATPVAPNRVSLNASAPPASAPAPASARASASAPAPAPAPAPASPRASTTTPPAPASPRASTTTPPAPASPRASTTTPPTPDEDEEEKPSYMTRGIQAVSGLDDDTAEAIGRVGGAVTNAGLGALALYDGLDNVTNNKKFFDPSASKTADVNTVTSMIAGASDVVGLVPGLEWVAGVGNAIGGVGGVIKMFGDHDAFKAQKGAEDAIKDNITPPAVAPLSTGSEVANIGGASSTLTKGTSSVY